MHRVTYQKYRRFPAKQLGSLVAHFVSERGGKVPDELYASIRRKQDGSRPFFGEDRLCGIERVYGAKLLSATCSIYPRSLTVVNGTLEGSLSLSCPEAARAVLLQEDSTAATANLHSGEFRTDNVFGIRKRSGLDNIFLPTRTLITALIRDRSRPVWQRLLLVASLCKRLDGITGSNPRSTQDLLRRYEIALGQGPSEELEQLNPRVATRLELAIALSNQRSQDRDCSKRFIDVFWDFIEGIASSASAEPDEDMRRFDGASKDYLSPFFALFPYVIENYLLNYVFQQGFPFGRVGSNRFLERSLFDEAVLLITQFSWLTTLLTGVAGRYGHEFSQTQLITTVQAFTRAVEHSPAIQLDALAFVKSRDLACLAGLAQLLRT